VPAKTGSALNPTVLPAGFLLVTGRHPAAKMAAATATGRKMRSIDIPFSNAREADRGLRRKWGGAPRWNIRRRLSIKTPIFPARAD